MNYMYYLLLPIPIFLIWYFYPRPVVIRKIYIENAYPLGVNKNIIIETDENKNKMQVEEDTPEGKVIIRMDNETFLYWSDRKVAYKYLEMVARKYVILYDCKDKYVNIFKELYIAATKIEEYKEDSIYVKLKPYNTIHGKLNKSKLVPEKSNKYIWKGKYAECGVHKEVLPIKQIKFADFKYI